jgi:predicted Zn-dependent protease with MMP-like domain/predicted Zn-dependent protease
VVPLPVCEPKGRTPLDAARDYYDAGDLPRALSCAADASAESPADPQTHSERAAALSALGRLDDAALAYAQALAIDPDHLDALLGAAHLYGVALPSTRERDLLAVTYAERGLSLSKAQKDPGLVADFALLAAMAHNDLGEPGPALERAEEALAVHPDDRDVRYERAMALFELDRFSEAKAAFEALLGDPVHRAHVSYHLGLLLEREGKWEEAKAHLSLAHTLSPADFPEPVAMGREDFRAAVAHALASLPEDMQRDVKGIPVTAEELPKDADLLGDPPLSPTILGLFRGPSLGEACLPQDGTPCRSIALYRRNLERAVSSREELLEQIRVTLLHEIGHLRGEDDSQLAARGLE